VAPDERQSSLDSYFALMAKGGEDLPQIRRSIYTSSGGFRTYQIGRLILRDPNGEPVGLRVVLADVTEHVASHEREKTARLWLESISDSLAEAVVVTDTLGFIRFANAAATHLTEWEQNELLRMSIAKAIPILSYSRAEGIPFNYRLVLERRSSGIITFLTKNKQQATTAFSTAPILDKHKGSTIGVSYVFRKPDMPL
jgi:PAS domain-containing protein